MKNRILTLIFAVVFSLFSFALYADAQIRTDSDIFYKRNQLQVIVNQDFMSFINKNEMIGSRKDSFNIDTQFYKNYVYGLIEKINKSTQQMEIIRSSQELSDTDKMMQINNIYQDIDYSMYDLDSKTINYLLNCKKSMPTLTFQTFAKKFQDFYNNFKFTNNRIYIN